MHPCLCRHLRGRNLIHVLLRFRRQHNRLENLLLGHLRSLLHSTSVKCQLFDQYRLNQCLAVVIVAGRGYHRWQISYF